MLCPCGATHCCKHNSTCHSTVQHDLLQVATLDREVTNLRESLQLKDADLANAHEAGSAHIQDLQSARQELASNIDVAQKQLQVKAPVSPLTMLGMFCEQQYITNFWQTPT